MVKGCDACRQGMWQIVLHYNKAAAAPVYVEQMYKCCGNEYMAPDQWQVIYLCRECAVRAGFIW